MYRTLYVIHHHALLKFYGLLRSTYIKQVKIASAHNISFSATGGGHGVSRNFANIQNAIDIDLSNFKTVELDAENNQVTVGGGATYGQLYDPLYAAGKEIRKHFSVPFHCLNFCMR